MTRRWEGLGGVWEGLKVGVWEGLGGGLGRVRWGLGRVKEWNGGKYDQNTLFT